MSDGISAAERAAMKELAAERRMEAKRAKQADKAAAERGDALAKIAAMSKIDRELAEAIDKTVLEAAPQLCTKTCYGMPAYHLEGKVICFFQEAGKFESRYASFGFQEAANLDDGNMWVTTFAVTKIGPKERETITRMVKQAVIGAPVGAPSVSK